MMKHWKTWITNSQTSPESRSW